MRPGRCCCCKAGGSGGAAAVAAGAAWQRAARHVPPLLHVRCGCCLDGQRESVPCRTAVEHSLTCALLPPLCAAARWALHGTNVAVTALLGEWLCMQKEMQDIPLANLRRNRANAGAAATLGGLAGAAARVAGGGGGGTPSSSSSNGTLGSGRLSNVRTSTANIMELGRVSHAGTQQEQAALITPKAWAPISPLE